MSSTYNDATVRNAEKGKDLQAAALERVRMGGYVGEQARVYLMKEHYSWIVQRCTHILGNEADAFDAAQEVSLCMHRSLPTFEGRSSLKTWLNRIVSNECVNLIRRQQKNAQIYRVMALTAIHEQLLLQPGPDDSVSEELVQQAMGMLSPEHREVLQLRFFSDLPIAEIGLLLGLSLSAAKMRLYRAIDAFKLVFVAIVQPDESYVGTH